MLLAGNVVNHTYSSLGVFNVSIITKDSGCYDTITGIVNNLRPPIPSILALTGGTYSGCAPLTIVIRDSTLYALPGTTISWDFGNGGGVFSRNYQLANDTISYTYPLSSALAACPKNITLKVSNALCGSPVTSSLSGFVNVYNKSASAIRSPINLCLIGRSYTFSNISTNNCVGGDRYLWETSDSTIGWTSSKGNVTITFSSFGSKSIKLIDSNACGLDTATATININRSPLAGFTASPDHGCEPLFVNFTDTSLGVGLSHSWNFGDPLSGSNTSTIANPTHTYNNPGTYTVTLTVSNSCAPSSTTTKTIHVYASPIVSIGGANSGCVPHSINLTNTTQNISPSAQVLWDFGGGDTTSSNIPGTRTFNTPGSYPVKLIVIDSCGTDSALVTIYVSTIPVASFSATSVCRGDTTQFTNTSTIASGDSITAYTWWFGDGDSATTNNPKHIYSNDGTYQVVLQITTDKTCIDFDTMNVSVKVAPRINYTVSSNFCNGDTVTLNSTATTSTGTITSNLWTLSTGDSMLVEDTSFLFPTAGNYTIRYMATNSLGCSADTSSNITISPIPVSKFSSSTACFGKTTQFYDSSTIANANSISQWNWDFNNDGMTDSTSQNPTYIFPSAGTYTIKLTVGSNNNCFNTDSIIVNVNSLPIVNISSSVNSICKFDSLTLNNTTTGAVSYLWKFGDTSSNFITSSTSSFNKSYSDTGLFLITLIALSSNGCSDSASLNIHSRPLPIASFTTNDTIACTPKTFSFSNNSILSDNYLWIAGDTQTSYSFNLPDTTLYFSGQSLLVKLIATNIYGCKPDTVQKSISTFANPISNFTLSSDSGCGPLIVNFNNSSLGASTYHWIFGNGKDTSQLNPSTLYVESQTIDTIYSVKLIVTNINGCNDSISKTIKVFPKPISAFDQDIQNGCGPLPINFTNQSIHKSSGTINDMTFNWSFGNGMYSHAKDTSINFSASHIVDTIYPIKLISFSKYGCSDTSTNNVEVFPNATAQFLTNINAGCGSLVVNFNNTSLPNDTGTISGMSFKWDFSNGTISTAANPSSTFIANATKDSVYNVRLIAYNEHNCPDTTYSNIRVYPNPLSSFNVNDTAGCGPLSIFFTNNSIPYDTGNISIMSFIWDFGNGLNSLSVNPNVQYVSKTLSDTIYHIKLIAFSEHGCIDTSYKNITVHPNPVIGFNSNKSVGCGPLTINFTNTTQLGAKYNWHFGDGDSSSAINTSHTFTSYDLVDSIYTVTLSALSYFGCASDTAFSTITARYNPIASFINSSDSICGTGTVAFYNASSGSTGNVWDFGNGYTSTAYNPVSTFTALPNRDTTYFVKLIIRSPYNCRDTTVMPVKVNAIPNASFAMIAPGCSPLLVNFNNASQRGVKYEWNFGDATSDSISNPQKVFENTTALINRDYLVTLKVYSASGCTDTAKRNIIVYPKPLSAFSANKTPRCDTASFNFLNTTVGATNYLWNFGDNRTETVFSPLHYYKTAASNDTNFIITLITSSANGCKDTTTQIVNIKPLVHSIFSSSNTSSCSNLNVQFTNSSLNAFSYLWLFGDGTGSIITSPSHQYNQSGSFKISLITFDSSGCSDTSSKPNYINVYDVPIANLLVSPQPTAIPNATLQFTNLSTSNSGNLSYVWNFGDALSSSNTSTLSNPTHTYSDSGNYIVTLISVSVNNCTDTVKSNIRIGPPIPIASFTYNPASGCEPLTVNFTNTSQYANSYSWDFGDASTSIDKDPMHIYSLPGVYNVFLRATGLGGIDDTVQLQIIDVFQLPKANFIVAPIDLYLPNATSFFTNTSYNNVINKWSLFKNSQITTYWEDTNTSTSYTFFEEGIYSMKLIVISKNGCIDSISQNNIISVKAGGTFFVPNAFTPDGDNINDIFIPKHTGVLAENYSMHIYDRWGMRVFETADINEGWDGKIKGDPADTDVYVWLIEGVYVGGKTFSQTGTVTLIR